MMNIDAKSATDIALEDIFFIPRMLGTFPFSKENKFTPWRLIILFIYFSLVTFKIFEVIMLADTLTGIISFLQHGMLIVVPLTHIIWLLVKISCIEQLIYKLNQFEKNMQEVGLSVVYQFTWPKKYFSLTIAFLLGVNLSISYLSNIVFVLFFCFWIYISNYTVFDQIFGIASVISSWLSYLKYVKENQLLVREKAELISLFKTAEDCFGPQLLIATTFTIAGLVFTLFSFFINPEPNAFVTSAMVLINIIPLMRIIVAINSIIFQVKDINKLLYRRLIANPNDELLEFHLIAKRNITFTPCGFFNLEISLIGSVIKVCTTYLVILLQYSSRN